MKIIGTGIWLEGIWKSFLMILIIFSLVFVSSIIVGVSFRIANFAIGLVGP